jgi:hypothetical protein
MQDIIKRNLLFLIGCIGTRLSIVYIAKTQPKYLMTMGYIALLPALGFILIYLFDLRKTGSEVFGEKIWWNDLRPLHGIIWFIFAYLAIKKNSKDAWKVLLLDTLIGVVAFLNHRKYI